MVVHSAPCIELTGTAGTFEPRSLLSIPDMKATVACLPHKAGKKHAGPGKISWSAGQIMQGGNKQKEQTSNKVFAVF
jgi:hypothetical protein